MLSFTEDTFEQAVIELFENMGYTHIYAPDMNRTNYSRPLLDDVLRDCLVRLNRSLPAVAIDEAILKLNDFDAGSLLQKKHGFLWTICKTVSRSNMQSRVKNGLGSKAD